MLNLCCLCVFVCVYAGYCSGRLSPDSRSQQVEERREGEGERRRQREGREGRVCRSPEGFEDSVDDEVSSFSFILFLNLFKKHVANLKISVPQAGLQQHL